MAAKRRSKKETLLTFLASWVFASSLLHYLTKAMATKAQKGCQSSTGSCHQRKQNLFGLKDGYKKRDLKGESNSQTQNYVTKISTDAFTHRMLAFSIQEFRSVAFNPDTSVFWTHICPNCSHTIWSLGNVLDGGLVVVWCYCERFSQARWLHQLVMLTHLAYAGGQTRTHPTH